MVFHHVGFLSVAGAVVVASTAAATPSQTFERNSTMWLFNQSSTTARTALFYITAGAFAVVWTGVWFVYLFNNPPETNSAYYWCTGILVTGLTLVLIGLGLGRFGRPAPVAAPQQPLFPFAPDPQANAPTATPVVALLNLAKPVAATDGQIVVPPPKDKTPAIRGS
jgi:hypothetical protein